MVNTLTLLLHAILFFFLPSLCSLFLSLFFVAHKNFWVRTVPKVWLALVLFHCLLWKTVCVCVCLWFGYNEQQNSDERGQKKIATKFILLEWKSIYALFVATCIPSTWHRVHIRWFSTLLSLALVCSVCGNAKHILIHLIYLLWNFRKERKKKKTNLFWLHRFCSVAIGTQYRPSLAKIK